jgi:hypothetical protein
MTYMRSWKSHRLTSNTWLGLNPQIGRPLSRIVGAIGFFYDAQPKINHSFIAYCPFLLVAGCCCWFILCAIRKKILKLIMTNLHHIIQFYYAICYKFCLIYLIFYELTNCMNYGFFIYLYMLGIFIFASIFTFCGQLTGNIALYMVE